MFYLIIRHSEMLDMEHEYEFIRNIDISIELYILFII